VSWNASTSDQVVGYRIYFGTASRTYQQSVGNGFNVGNTTSYRITGLTTGRTYFVAVTAVDAGGRESDLSEEKSKAIP
jgi:fibronectin type 3 domain-containing protein